MADTSVQRDYYCSMKFRFLKIDLERNTIYNCHAAKPHTVDISWLKNNTGELFNNPRSLAEREMMLRNERNSSCEQNCWPAEDKGMSSPRLGQNGAIKTHSVIKTQPEIIDITLGSNCNLSCSYCCKEYSSSWRKDILEVGEYIITDLPDRYSSWEGDIAIHNMSYSDKQLSESINLLKAECISALPTLKRLVITGGEPLLDPLLPELLKHAAAVPVIWIFTGLGVSFSRFTAIVNKIKDYTNVIFILSGEGIGKFAEFNRYGIAWDEYDAKVKFLVGNNIKFRPQIQLSNLTLFGLSDYFSYYATVNPKATDFPPVINFVTVPTFMNVNVLDEVSKSNILSSLTNCPAPFNLSIVSVYETIKESIGAAPPTELQKLQLKEFLTQYVARRPDLSLSIFPQHFLDWVGL